MKKTVQSREELFIQFTDEEIVELGFKEGDKLYFEAKDDGTIVLSKGATLELDLSDFSRETLEALIKHSCESNKPISDLIEDALRWAINNKDKLKDMQKISVNRYGNEEALDYAAKKRAEDLFTEETKDMTKLEKQVFLKEMEEILQKRDRILSKSSTKRDNRSEEEGCGIWDDPRCPRKDYDDIIDESNARDPGS